jgi:hypothetical protein
MAKKKTEMRKEEEKIEDGDEVVKRVDVYARLFVMRNKDRRRYTVESGYLVSPQHYEEYIDLIRDISAICLSNGERLDNRLMRAVYRGEIPREARDTIDNIISMHNQIARARVALTNE